MKRPSKGKTSPWKKTHYANIVQYRPSKTYFARIRINGKLIRRKLKTTSLSAAKLLLADLETEERKKAENQVEATDGRMTFGEALSVYTERLKGDASIKPRTRDYHQQRIKALLKSWPELKRTEIRNLGKSACLNWAAKFSQKRSTTGFNHTIGILKRIVEIGVEAGVRYDNPARFIKRLRETSSKPVLPEMDKFEEFVAELENGHSRDSQNCADLVRFLAYGGFRKTEAANITWGDCDLNKGKIIVRGDPHTGTKNSETREVPMIPDMKQLIDRLRQERPDEPITEPVMKVRECQNAMDRAAGGQNASCHSS
jgi:integrase